MPAVPKHRAPIIDAAVMLFRRQGYGGTGLNDIVDASGAPKGSLYHYFPEGKASIAIAAVEEAGRRVAETMMKLARESRSTGDLLRAPCRVVGGMDAKVGLSRRMPDHRGPAGTGARAQGRVRGRPEGLCGPASRPAGQADR